jgi:hypothetical protein
MQPLPCNDFEWLNAAYQPAGLHSLPPNGFLKADAGTIRLKRIKPSRKRSGRSTKNMPLACFFNAY